MELDFQIQIAVCAAVVAGQTLSRQTDLLAFGNAFGDFDVEGFGLITDATVFVHGRHVQIQRTLRADISGVNIDTQFGMLVFAFNRAGRPCVRLSLIAAEAGKQIFKIEIARAERFAAAVFVVEAAGLPPALRP